MMNKILSVIGFGVGWLVVVAIVVLTFHVGAFSPVDGTQDEVKMAMEYRAGYCNGCHHLLFKGIQ